MYMSYTEAFENVNRLYPNVHIEANFDGWDWFFSNVELVATYNNYSGEYVEIKEVA